LIARSVVTLDVADVERSIKFYVETLGFKLRYSANESNAGKPDWAEVDGPGVTFGLHRATGAKPGLRGSIRVGLEVDQPLDEVVAVLENRGVKFSGSVTQGAVRFIAFGDPDGTALYLYAPSAAG
jgi:catechol 2,3-dioxygenase-like lactoylglutathione lyase family enzyme